MQKYKDFQPTGFDCKGLGLEDQQEWLVGPSRTRDSGPLAESNFACTLEALGGEGDDVEVHRFGHWGPGWFEIIITRPDTVEAGILEEIEAALADYPVLDDVDYSERETELANEVWLHCYSLAERIDLCREAGVSIFAARHDYSPNDDSGYIWERLIQ